MGSEMCIRDSIKVLPGTPLLEIETTLKQKNQFFGFEPNDLGYLYDGKSNSGSIGGVVSCNLSGPGRFKNGALRDHVLGFKSVNGSGGKVKSGGTVVKNVTGYDLSKIISGAYGTLCAITEINLKVSPLPEFEETFLVNDIDYVEVLHNLCHFCLLYTSPSPRDLSTSRMPSSA